MDKIKVLHVMDKLSVEGSQIAGPARQIAYRVPHYDPSRWEVMLCNLRNEDAGSELLRSRGVPVVSLNRGRLDPRTLTDVLRLLRSWRPSLLHLHGYAAWTFGRIAGRIAGIPIILQEHFVDDQVPAYQRVADWLLAGIGDRGLAVSQAVREFMVEGRYVRTITIEVVDNGIPVDELETGDPERLRRSLGIADDAPVVGTVGRLARMKGHEHFLGAARRIAAEEPRAVFVVVGEGWLHAELERRAHDLGIGERVIFAGYRSNVLEYLGMFDVNVVASVEGEGFNTVGIETFAAETSLVITDLPAFRGLYVGGENALMVPPGDEQSLARAVLRLLREPELAERLVEGGRRTLARCDMRVVAPRYTRLYEEILGERARA